MPGGHEPRLMQQLRLLLQQQRVAMLASCTPDGLPHASMVPFAVEPTQGYWSSMSASSPRIPAT